MIYLLKPLLSSRLWGGKTLSKIFHEKTNEKIGEAWIMSCLDKMNSPIQDSSLTLKDVFKKNKNIVKKGYRGEFPLLIKLIDAQDDLSIQVHPNVKTESWHILSKKPSKLYLGLKKNSNKKIIADTLKNGDITKLLNNVKVKQGDTYLIKPGTIHAIGKGTFLIEIQQSADVTYRLYDFHRVDKNGHERELHIDQALKVIDYHQLKVKTTNKKHLLVASNFFHVYDYKINKTKSFIANEKSFHAITIVNGHAIIVCNKQQLKLKTFDTVFIPANEGKYIVKGQAEIVLTTL